MSKSQGKMDARRLVDVADAVIRAVAEIAAKVGGAAPHPLVVVGTAAQPKCLANYAPWEVEQGCEFLARLGFLDAARPSKTA